MAGCRPQLAPALRERCFGDYELQQSSGCYEAVWAQDAISTASRWVGGPAGGGAMGGAERGGCRVGRYPQASGWAPSSPTVCMPPASQRAHRLQNSSCCYACLPECTLPPSSSPIGGLTIPLYAAAAAAGGTSAAGRRGPAGRAWTTWRPAPPHSFASWRGDTSSSRGSSSRRRGRGTPQGGGGGTWCWCPMATPCPSWPRCCGARRWPRTASMACPTAASCAWAAAPRQRSSARRGARADASPPRHLKTLLTCQLSQHFMYCSVTSTLRPTPPPPQQQLRQRRQQPPGRRCPP